MDVSQIATLAIPTLCGFLDAGGKTIAEGIAGDLWTFIKGIFSSEPQKKAIAELERTPNDAIAQAKAISKLEEILDANPDLKEELSKILEKIPKDTDNTIESYNQTITGNQSNGVQGVKNSTININK